MLINVATLVPSSIPPQKVWARSLGLQDSAMARLLVLASEHVSHLHELGIAECAGTLKVLELLGTSILQLAVAHTIHLSDVALRANIDETGLLVVITEQGENRNQCE